MFSCYKVIFHYDTGEKEGTWPLRMTKEEVIEIIENTIKVDSDIVNYEIVEMTEEEAKSYEEELMNGKKKKPRKNKKKKKLYPFAKQDVPDNIVH